LAFLPKLVLLIGNFARASGLIAELGFEPVDAGGLTRARYLEPLAMLWISMAYRYGNGPDFGFRVVRR
jgi:8-hydroxy-5-deazaflavin:NADPH oxidoreductase